MVGELERLEKDGQDWLILGAEAEGFEKLSLEQKKLRRQPRPSNELELGLVYQTRPTTIDQWNWAPSRKMRCARSSNTHLR